MKDARGGKGLFPIDLPGSISYTGRVFRNRQKFGLFSAFGGFLLLVGCAGAPLSQIAGSNELPHDLPKDLQDKFEVKDSSVLNSSAGPGTGVSTAPKQAATSNEAPGRGRKKKRKSNRSDKKAESTALVYPSRRPKKDPIWIGEKSTFEITYFGMAAGDFTLETLPCKAIDGRKVYHVRGTAVSSKVFNLFYRLNDSVETFIDYDGLFSHRFHLVLDETKQTRDALELYDSEKAQTFYWNRWNHKEHGYTETKDFQPIAPFSQDSLSGLFYLRTVPLEPGTVVTFPVVSEGKSWEAVVTVIRREIVDTPVGRLNTVVVKPETRYQGVLQKKGDSFLWLTDDDRRFIVRLEAKVKIGTVVAALKKIEPGTAPAEP